MTMMIISSCTPLSHINIKIQSFQIYIHYSLKLCGQYFLSTEYYHSAKEPLKLIKSDSKDIYISNKFCSLELSSENPEKNITVSSKFLSSITAFIIDNNQKCFLSIKSSY